MKHLLGTSNLISTLFLSRSTGQLPTSVQLTSAAVSCKRKACQLVLNYSPNSYLSAAFKRYTNQQAFPAFQMQRVVRTLYVRERLLVRPHHGFHDRKHQHLYPRRYFRGPSNFAFTGKNNMCGLYDYFSSERMGHGFYGFPTSCYSLFLFLYRS